MAIAPERPAIYEGTRIPSPIPTMLQPAPGLEDILTVNFGPNHPSTHGVLRLICDLHGEDVVGLEAIIGYLHTGFEKNMEQKTWWKCITGVLGVLRVAEHAPAHTEDRVAVLLQESGRGVAHFHHHRTRRRRDASW